MLVSEPKVLSLEPRIVAFGAKYTGLMHRELAIEATFYLSEAAGR